MNQVTQNTAANAEESASASEELSGQAEAMGGVVSHLRELVESATASIPRCAKPLPCAGIATG